jgi:hypothetical protein
MQRRRSDAQARSKLGRAHSRGIAGALQPAAHRVLILLPGKDTRGVLHLCDLLIVG